MLLPGESGCLIRPPDARFPGFIANFARCETPASIANQSSINTQYDELHNYILRQNKSFAR